MMTISCRPSLTPWGDASITWIAEHLRHPVLSPMMLFFSELGHVGVVLFTIALCYWFWNKRHGKYLCYGMFGTLFINLWLKGLIRECRPPHGLWMEDVDIFSFPSGHAQVGILLWWGFAYYSRNQMLSVVCLFIGLMIAFSRLYLGVHYPQDITAGAVIGLGTLAICLLFEKKQYTPFKKFPLWGKTIILLLLLSSYLVFIHDPKHIGFTVASCFLGFWLGCQFEEKYVQFKPSVLPLSLFKQILIGTLGLILLYPGLSWILHGVPTQLALGFHSLQYFLLGLWIAYGAPLICLRFNYVTSTRLSKF